MSVVFYKEGCSQSKIIAWILWKFNSNDVIFSNQIDTSIICDRKVYFINLWYVVIASSVTIFSSQPIPDIKHTEKIYSPNDLCTTVWKYFFPWDDIPPIVQYFLKTDFSARAIVLYFMRIDPPFYKWDTTDYKDVERIGIGCMSQIVYNIDTLITKAQQCWITLFPYIKVKISIINSSILQQETGNELIKMVSLGAIWWYNFDTNKTHILLVSKKFDLTKFQIKDLTPVNRYRTSSNYIIDNLSIKKCCKIISQ
jgi:hypothetical protein